MSSDQLPPRAAWERGGHVCKSGRGESGVFDEDGFEDAVREGLITESERTAALAAVSELGLRISGYDPVFDDIGWKHLAAACQLSLPPLRTLP
jgi:hypothetical protein